MVKLKGKIAQCSTKAKLQKGFYIHVYRSGIENHDESLVWEWGEVGHLRIGP